MVRSFDRRDLVENELGGQLGWVWSGSRWRWKRQGKERGGEGLCTKVGRDIMAVSEEIYTYRVDA